MSTDTHPPGRLAIDDADGLLEPLAERRPGRLPRAASEQESASRWLHDYNPPFAT
ncbi:hypothetical protein WLW65_15925 [Bordetella bronchiseptica]